MNERLLRFVMVLVMSCTLGISAQAQWQIHQSGERTQETKIQQMRAQQEEPSEIYIGHCSVYDYIYPYDGLSLDYDAHVGVGMKLTRDMIEPYIGGIVTAIYAGWDDENSSSTYDCFIRTGSFNGETISSGSGEAHFGWNRINVSSVPIPDVDEMYVGFYTDIKKDVCCIPFIYPTGQPNSVFLHSGEKDSEGNELWYDMAPLNFGKMPIMLVIMDRNGKFHNLVGINNIRANTVVWREEVHNASFLIKNLGSNEITSIEVETTFGDMSLADEIVFEDSILTADEGWIQMPIYCLGTGEHTIRFSKVNGETPKTIATTQFEMIGVPYDLEGVYSKLPLIEYFVSEEEYAVPRYFDELFWPGFKDYESKFNLVFHHIDDKYMWGDNEALLQMLSLANNDSSLILVPSFTVDRSDHMEYLATLHGSPFHYGTPFPEHVSPMWEGLIDDPTFASVNVNATYEEESGKVKITVSGDVADGVMPDGEPLYLTVYLMEKDVLSMDQKFWDDNDKSEHEGKYVHKNIVRDILTPYWGEELAQTGGEYSMTFEADTYSDYNLSNLYVTAFLNRGENKHHMSRQIINSANGSIKGLDAVGNITTDKNVTMVVLDGAVYVNGSTENVEVFNLAGAQVANGSLADGVYLVRCNDVVGKVLVR